MGLFIAAGTHCAHRKGLTFASGGWPGDVFRRRDGYESSFAICEAISDRKGRRWLDTILEGGFDTRRVSVSRQLYPLFHRWSSTANVSSKEKS